MDSTAECPLSVPPTTGLPPPPRYEEVPGTVPLHTGRTSGPPPSYDDVINPDGESIQSSDILFHLPHGLIPAPHSGTSPLVCWGLTSFLPAGYVAVSTDG